MTEILEDKNKNGRSYQVTEQITILENSTGVLTESINELETRLNSVLRIPLSPEKKEKKEDDIAQSVPLANMLKEVIDRIVAENTQLRAIISRLEL